MEIVKTDTFSKWLNSLKDRKAKITITGALETLDKPSKKIKPVRKGIKEYKIDYGPGYRIYFTERNGTIFIILAGGDKSSQDKDIKKAEILLEEFSDELK